MRPPALIRPTLLPLDFAPLAAALPWLMTGVLMTGLTGCSGPGAEAREPVSLSIAAPAAPSVVIDTAPWDFGAIRGSVTRTPHYRIFSTVTKPILIGRMPLFAELSLRHYRTSLAQLPAPPARLDTYLMSTRGQWETLTRAITRERAEIFLRIERGGFASGGRGVYRDLGDLNDTFNLAAHEGWHQYTQLTFKSRLPVVLEEGIAAYMEGFTWRADRPEEPEFRPWANLERFRALRSAADAGRLMSLPELAASTPQELIARDQEQALVWYAQAWALVHFLHEGQARAHSAAFARLLTDAAEGRIQTDARSRFQTLSRADERAANLTRGGTSGGLLQAYFGRDAAGLDPEYQAFIAAVVAPGMQHAVAAGRSPIADNPSANNASRPN